jgi:hypothetical protein
MYALTDIGGVFSPSDNRIYLVPRKSRLFSMIVAMLLAASSVQPYVCLYWSIACSLYVAFHSLFRVSSGTQSSEAVWVGACSVVASYMAFWL